MQIEPTNVRGRPQAEAAGGAPAGDLFDIFQQLFASLLGEEIEAGLLPGEEAPPEEVPAEALEGEAGALLAQAPVPTPLAANGPAEEEGAVLLPSAGVGRGSGEAEAALARPNEPAGEPTRNANADSPQTAAALARGEESNGREAPRDSGEDEGRRGADETAAHAARSAEYDEAREAARARMVSFEASAPDLASGASGATAARSAGVDPVALPSGAPAPAALQPGAEARATAPAAAPPAESVPLHVEWLVARGGGRARVRLHPPELGEIQLTVTVRGQDVEVAVRAQEASAGQLVLASRDQLADGLASRDLRMEGFDVQWDEQEGPAREEREGRPDARGREHPGDAPPRPTPSRDDALPVLARTPDVAPASSLPANDRVDLHV